MNAYCMPPAADEHNAYPTATAISGPYRSSRNAGTALSMAYATSSGPACTAACWTSSSSAATTTRALCGRSSDLSSAPVEPSGVGRSSRSNRSPAPSAFAALPVGSAGTVSVVVVLVIG